MSTNFERVSTHCVNLLHDGAHCMSTQNKGRVSSFREGWVRVDDKAPATS